MFYTVLVCRSSGGQLHLCKASQNVLRDVTSSWASCFHLLAQEPSSILFSLFIKGTLPLPNKIAFFFFFPKQWQLVTQCLSSCLMNKSFLPCAKAVRGCRVKEDQWFPHSCWGAAPSAALGPVQLDCHREGHLEANFQGR